MWKVRRASRKFPWSFEPSLMAYLSPTRQFFLYLSQQRKLRHWMETSPLAQKLTRRFIAGTTLAEELAVCGELQRAGMTAALDHLGENVVTLAEASLSLAAYLEALDEITRRSLPCTVSIKLTQFGLDLSEAECLKNARSLARRAREIGTRVEIDMESTAYTERTIAIATTLAGEFGNIRCVIQAYLYRSLADIVHMNLHGIPVRLCKGAYDEPASLAYPGKAEVDKNYIALMHALLDGGTDPAIATHDERMIAEAQRYARQRGIDASRFEFQMLYGIRRDLQRRLVDQGYRLRLYVPYGAAWYPYFMRRLAERPANVLFLLRSLFS
jgi:proline dehydrogenase